LALIFLLIVILIFEDNAGFSNGKQNANLAAGADLRTDEAVEETVDEEGS
jgi:hypothetical protein